MEAEFFRYRKGAFTAPERDREGFFQAAAGGTLFSTKSPNCRWRCSQLVRRSRNVECEKSARLSRSRWMFGLFVPRIKTWAHL